MRSFCYILFCLFALNAFTGDKDAIPAHPSELTFKPLIYEAPKADAIRHVLAKGAVAFMVEDHALPLINISITIRTGTYMDPQGKAGLARIVAAQMRDGGTAQWPAEKFDETVDFLAANLSCRAGATSSAATANFLTKDLDQILPLFFDMLRNPVFQKDRMEQYVSSGLQGMERRNDRTDSIERREWNRLLRGPDHFSTRQTSKASLESITREDMLAFNKRFFHPANFTFAISGDFDTADLKARLQKIMADWQGEKNETPIPQPNYTPVPGMYMVNKSDVNQGRVSVGQPGIKWDHPDAIAVDMMNDILGGSGFTSRITNRVRTDEGLAYSAGSRYRRGTWYEGSFQAFFQSKSPSCAQATAIVLEEIDRIRSEKVSQEELDTVKNSAIEIFPRFFASAGSVARTFARDEFMGRDLGYWATYRDKIRAVTIDDVLRVAKKHLNPDNLIVLAVGNTEDMLTGNADKPEYSFEKLAGKKAIVTLPLPDPLTMEYPEN